jgi:hypothetical protein
VLPEFGLDALLFILSFSETGDSLDFDRLSLWMIGQIFGNPALMRFNQQIPTGARRKPERVNDAT